MVPPVSIRGSASLSLAATQPIGFLRRHASIAVILVLALAIRLWQLDRNGWGTEYYSAAVRSMLESWHNFFFNAFDPAGFVSIDKPPVAFWIQAASARLLGFSSFSLLLPQVLEGAAGILILHHLVRRRFGATAGLLAALFLALTPISVAVDRANNTDACLVLVLLLSGWAMILAAERGSFGWLVAAMALVGLGFNVKMLAACVVLPGFAALYLYGAPIGFARRITHLAGAGLVFAVIALSWCVAYDLAAPETRPYVDSTAENSMLELAIGHNGVQRFLPRLRRNRPAAAARQAAAPAPDANTGTISPPGADPAAAAQRRQAIGDLRQLDNPPAGPLRLANRHLAGQVLWLLPLALVGFAAALRQSGLRRPLAPDSASLLLWVGWALTYGVVYSAADGIFHTYYLVTMAQPLAALAGIAVVHLRARAGRAAWLLPLAFAATAAWQAYIEAPYIGSDSSENWRLWLFVLLLGGSLLAVLGLTAAVRFRWTDPVRHYIRRGAIALALIALLATPTAWALSTVIGQGNNVSAPAATIALLAPSTELTDLRPRFGTMRDVPPAKLLPFLEAHRQGEAYLMATANSRLAAPLIITSGQAVMAMGGFTGRDPILTPEELADLVGKNKLRYVLLAEPDLIDRAFNAQIVQAPLADWVRTHGKPVDPAEWRGPADAPAQPTPRRRGFGFAQAELYDLRPDPI
jgi:4-amino-4-deoxy-L-arabinose transferase-like glycosyltransferase